MTTQRRSLTRWLRQAFAAALSTPHCAGYQFDEESPFGVYDKIFSLMARLHVSFYDAAYHATALKYRGTFVTADLKYVRRASGIGHVAPLQGWKPA